MAEEWSVREEGDPLNNGIWQDDVRRVAKDTGVLTRDGGHFAAVFADEERAKRFQRAAAEFIQERLPGVRVETRRKRISRNGQEWAASEDADPSGGAVYEAVCDLPQAEVCEYSGNEPASKEVEVGGERIRVSQSVREKYEAGRRFDRGDTHDVLGILRPHLLKGLGSAEGGEQAFPAEFAELSVQGYLAVVHVDGNSVGTRFDAYRHGFPRDFFERWRKGEEFFHRLRVGMRRAASQAIQRVFGGFRTRNNGQKLPLRLLMLGGDDLLLVCGAPWALAFVVELARELQTTTGNLPDAEGPLTVGAGVAVVHDSFPFHRAHELAEQLAQSAKRLKSALPRQVANVVDWLLVSESWHGDVAETRQRDLVLGDLVLSARPYAVLKEAAGEKSLEQMLEDAKGLAKATARDRFARGQLYALAAALAEGKHSAEFAAGALEEKTRESLRAKGYLTEEDSPWTEKMNGWRLTRILDLLELYELEMLAYERRSSGEAVQRGGEQAVGERA
ncbi:MAG: hypothetical protein NUV77_09895 [Thermoguttaceae bacterium]|nr:hypothetical protein [Thermoguttaceae bacterium]